MIKARLLELEGDNDYREPVLFQANEDGSLYVWIDGGETGDTEAGFYEVAAERTFSKDEVAKLVAFLATGFDK